MNQTRDKKHISQQVESWIAQDEIPAPSCLKPVKKWDLYSEMDDEEFEAYLDFMQWYLGQEHLPLLSIPKTEHEVDFWAMELDESGHDVSAFNTIDFQRLHPYRFDKYQYKLKKVYEKVKDLAITHSCISNEQGKRNTHQRYVNLVENEFRDRGLKLIESYKNNRLQMNKVKLKREIAALNSKIRKCKKIWQEYAYCA